MDQGQIIIVQIRKKMNRRILFFVSILIIFIACDSNKIYNNFCSIGAKNWDKDSIVSFQFDIIDTTHNYNIFLNTRNLENYPFSNLWLFIDIIAPDKRTVRDTIEYQLAKPNGQWIGKGTTGIYLNQFNFKSNIYFPLSGNYEIRVQHGMRDSNLKGLRDIGLTIEKN